MYLGFDHTVGDKISLVLGETPIPGSDRSFEEDNIEWLKRAKSIKEFSDGVKAFLGILIEALGGGAEILLIDEPEAFLHPSLGARLGRELGVIAKNQKKDVFCSVHSPSFILGLVQSGANINIIRLSFDKNVGSVNFIPSNEMRDIMVNPIYRSANLVNAIFHKSVVVVEGDSDRAFYNEINERMISVGRGISDTLFVNTNGKDQIHEFVGVLRKLGIPTAAIYDLDFMSNNVKGRYEIYLSSNLGDLDSIMRESGQIWSEIKGHLSKGNLFQTPLTESLANRLSCHIEILKRYGIFLVPCGSLEGWLPELFGGARISKKRWLSEVFHKLGADDRLPEYIRPGAGDVWAFLDEISKWTEVAQE